MKNRILILCCMFGLLLVSACARGSAPTASTSDLKAQATAHAIETENASANVTLTALARPVADTGTPPPEASATAVPASAIHADTAVPEPTAIPLPSDTPTPNVVVVTSIPANTQAPAPTKAPTVANNITGGGGQVGVCTSGCALTTPPAGCLIKGNVNSSKEKIYHTPGQRDYNKTQIKPAEGDAWFCAETDAQAAGFRHAQR